MKEYVAWAAIFGAATCLFVYFGLSYAVYKALRKARPVQNSSADKGTMEITHFTIDAKDIPPIIDSLVKAGPAFWSLVGSMLFLLIAALAAGVFTAP